MIKARLIFLVLIVFYTIDTSCQRQTAKKIVPDSLLILRKGIYMNINEFLLNEPSINYQFDKINNNPSYFIHPEERNGYFFTYYDLVGKKVTLSIKDIWGYYDGLGIFLSYKGKPYELIHLGAISILRYHQHYNKNVISQAFSLYAVGSTATSVEKTKDVLFDLKNDTIVTGSKRDFEKLLAKDNKLFNEYKNDRQTARILKTVVYIDKYNKRHPLKITKQGIEFTEIQTNANNR